MSNVALFPRGIYMEIESLRLDFYPKIIIINDPKCKNSKKSGRKEKKKRERKRGEEEEEEMEMRSPIQPRQIQAVAQPKSPHVTQVAARD